jgi:8-oxo-dGTP pyrophosphatase MutT (NUDIX family)
MARRSPESWERPRESVFASLGRCRVSAVGRVEHIHVAAKAGAPMRSLQQAAARAGVGIADDRYSVGEGHYSGNSRVSRDLTLVEAEVLESLKRDLGIAIGPGGTRRNIATRGVELAQFVGREFMIGEVRCRGTSLCEPCQYLADLVGQPIVRPLVHRAGLRADVLTDGNIRVGDPIVPIENLEASPLRGVGVLLMREGRLLVGQRLSGHGTGTWSVPGGKPEADESDEACASRELLEEAGVVGSAPRVVAETVDTFADAGLTYRTRFVQMDWLDGTPQAREPAKCADWQWHVWEQLPKPLFPTLVSLRRSGFHPGDAALVETCD